MYAWVRYAAGAGAGERVVKLDIDLCDPQGNVCVQMRGLCLQQPNISSDFSEEIQPLLKTDDSSSSHSAARAEEISQSLFFQEYWQEQPFPISKLPPGNAQFVIFSTTEFREKTINSDDPGPLRTACFVHQAESYQHACAQVYHCRLHDSGDICDVLGHVATTSQCEASPIVVIYTWAKDQQENGIHGLFNLFKAIKTSARTISHVILVGHYDPLSVDTCWDYSWIGFERSLKQLMPKTQISLLYTDSGSYTAEQLLDAWQHGGIIWYKANQRFVLSFKSFDLSKTAKEPILRHGTYLITGGCGALGLKFANYLAEKYQASLLLLGRRQLVPSIQEQLDALIRAGAKDVHYYAVDVSDKSAMTSWAEALPYRISGVIHAAGVESNLGFFDKTTTDINLVLHPKTVGTLILDEVLVRQPLDFVCYFSSTAALFGDFGACDYAIANRFQMAYGLYRQQREQGKGKTVVINWPLWQEGGMGFKAGAQRAQFLKMSAQEFGNEPLTTQSGIDIWHDSMRSNHLQTIVMVGKPTRVVKYLDKIYQAKPQTNSSVVTQLPIRSESDVAYKYANKVEEVYSLVLPSVSSDMEYLTFCPFESKKPGFSMSLTYLHPKEYAEDRRFVHLKQTEMRQVLFCKENFSEIKSVMDFGCGHGTDVIQIGSLFPHIEVHGFTITGAQADLGSKRVAAKGLGSHVQIYHKDSAKDPFPSKYDLIVGIEVCPHIDNKTGLFKNICDSLNDNGTILLADVIGTQQVPVVDHNIGINIPTQREWIRLISQFHLEIDEFIDVSPQISNFLYDPNVRDNVKQLPEVIQRTYLAYADLSVSLEKGLMSYVLARLKRNVCWEEQQIEEHNWRKMRNPTPYLLALEAMLKRQHIDYPPVELLTSRGQKDTSERIGYFSTDRRENEVSLAEESSISKLQNYLRASLAKALGLKACDIDMDQSFGDLGLDSFLGVEWVTAINSKYGTTLPNIIVYDYPSVNAMAHFLESELEKTSPKAETKIHNIYSAGSGLALMSRDVDIRRSIRTGRTMRSHTVKNGHTSAAEKVAIIGMSGRYPHAANLEEYWDNLVHGRNAIVEIPRSRWDIDQYYDPDPAAKDKTCSKWLGLMDDIDCFDPLFFRISPHEAVYMDPQHRLFLQESYRAFEDSGYSADTLSNKKCGVYLGIASTEYALLLSRHNVLSVDAMSNSHAIAAARIAYYLNLKGPAIAIDTACSSSLVAVHLACQGLLNHETDMALAGGVNLWFSPESYQAMSQAGMLSPDGQCKTFDDSANGIVVGEGVGAVVLKRLRDAESDNDHIYGVILGSGINQDGRTNGITAPSVNSQIDLLREIYARYKIDPETISYIETHGTGTKLGDPIELTALATVFKDKSPRRNYCALASVKSNIGHTGAAAGIASVHKVLLSLRDRTLVPSLNVTVENSHFDFRNSPFYINRERREWEAGRGGLRRRAGVSAFGFSGTNAHLVIEEYTSAVQPSGVDASCRDFSFIVPLSARTAEQLRQRASDLLEFIRGPRQDDQSRGSSLGSLRAADLSAVAYTLQVGREAMEERLAFVVRSVDQLIEKLSAYVNGEKDIEGAFHGCVKRRDEGVMVIGQDDDMQEVVDKWIARKKLSKVLDSWVKGLNLDWNKFYGDIKPHRISLPTYPFVKERYWVDEVASNESLDRGLEMSGNLKSIEEVISRIDNQSIAAEQGVKLLKVLV
jgi:3-oxoacyl-(acyl-carrier-protein) synthase/2-polyprenyl-3-methyl-5-hydroxy-6-metoxy-1,4-benzoquinol methylase/acyl carrier protein